MLGYIARSVSVLLLCAVSMGTVFGSQIKDGVFVKRINDRVFYDGKPISFKGIGFGNKVWQDVALPLKHHNEKDYARVKAMGMNVVRFYLNYKTFESDSRPYLYKASGWKWLDDNIEWARRNNIFLILNMHVPQGGYQANGQGIELWTRAENQKRLKALWKAIAARYSNEPVIAGYDLLNEPVTNVSITQWQDLAQEIIDGIRQVDANHMIIVERLCGIIGKPKAASETNFFLLNERNIMYEFHFYKPFEYTHQNTPWTKLGSGGSYPDKLDLAFDSDLFWAGASFSNPKCPPGDSKWRFYKGRKFKVRRKEFVVGKIALQANRSQGTVSFDELVVSEFDPEGKFVRRVLELKMDDASGWTMWSQDGNGYFQLDETGNRNGGACIQVCNTSADANCYNNLTRFQVKHGYSYRVDGWMKGQNLAARSACKIRIDFERSLKARKLIPRNKEFLARELAPFIEFGTRHKVPLFVGEFGLYRDCFMESKGGIEWLADVVELFDGFDLGYTYHCYHESAFGLFSNDVGLPDPDCLNSRLADFFTAHHSPASSN